MKKGKGSNEWTTERDCRRERFINTTGKKRRKGLVVIMSIRIPCERGARTEGEFADTSKEKNDKLKKKRTIRLGKYQEGLRSSILRGLREDEGEFSPEREKSPREAIKYLPGLGKGRPSRTKKDRVGTKSVSGNVPRQKPPELGKLRWPLRS